MGAISALECHHRKFTLTPQPGHGYEARCHDCGIIGVGSATAKNAMDEFEKKVKAARRREESAIKKGAA